MLSGWVDLEFEDGQKLRIESGESLYIPGGLRHNETAASKTWSSWSSPFPRTWAPWPAIRLEGVVQARVMRSAMRATACGLDSQSTYRDVAGCLRAPPRSWTLLLAEPARFVNGWRVAGG